MAETTQYCKAIIIPQLKINNFFFFRKEEVLMMISVLSSVTGHVVIAGINYLLLLPVPYSLCPQQAPERSWFFTSLSDTKLHSWRVWIISSPDWTGLLWFFIGLNHTTMIILPWELDHIEGWVSKNWYFWIVVLEKTLESSLNCKEIKPV